MRTNDWRAEEGRARLSVVVGGKPDAAREVLDGITTSTATMAAEARRTAHAQQLRRFADEVRALKRNVEGEVGAAATGLDAFARRLDQMAGSAAC